MLRLKIINCNQIVLPMKMTSQRILNVDNFSVNKHKYFSMVFYTYLGNIFILVNQMSRSQGRQVTWHKHGCNSNSGNFRHDNKIYKWSTYARNKTLVFIMDISKLQIYLKFKCRIMKNIWKLSLSTALAFGPHSIILVTTPYVRGTSFPLYHIPLTFQWPLCSVNMDTR